MALPVAAQGVVPQAPPPGVQIQPQPPARVEPLALPFAESDFGGSSKFEHDPAFIEPLAAQYETANGSGRYGFSGWTAPGPPIGARQLWQDHSGWFALGFSVTWDGPPAPKSRPR